MIRHFVWSCAYDQRCCSIRPTHVKFSDKPEIGINNKRFMHMHSYSELPCHSSSNHTCDALQILWTMETSHLIYSYTSRTMISIQLIIAENFAQDLIQCQINTRKALHTCPRWFGFTSGRLATACVLGVS